MLKRFIRGGGVFAGKDCCKARDGAKDRDCEHLDRLGQLRRCVPGWVARCERVLTVTSVTGG
jgi:hypothetical protein